MRKLATASLLAVALTLLLAAPSLAGGRHGGHGGSRVFISVGPRFWWGPFPYSYYYYPYPYPYYYTPPVVVQDPPVYVQQQVTPTPPASAEPAAPAAGYWYYCPSVREYYPTTPTCSEAWIKVPPRQE